MRLSEGVEWAMHCAVVLSLADRPVPTSRLAALHEVSGTYLAKHLQALAGAGIIAPTQGKGGGYTLARPADAISMLDVVEAIDGTDPTFRCTEIRQRGPVATPPEECRRPCGINAAMLAADRAWRTSLAGVSIADLAARADRTRSGDGSGRLAPAKRWLAGPTT